MHYFYRPLPSWTAIGAAVVLLLAGSIYCMTYSALAGRGETPQLGLLWASTNVLPWFIVFEAAKRASSVAIQAGLLALAFAFAILFYLLVTSNFDRLPFELLRKLPAILLICALLAVGRWAQKRSEAEVEREIHELPFLPHQLDWVSAAGNYVELHGSFGVLTRRASLASLEAQFRHHGFVRIHRSTLVRRDKIARVRPTHVVLQDGTNLRTGMRYRASILQGR